MARPTKYTPELIERAKTYLDVYADNNQAFPSDIGLAAFLNIASSTLYDWATHANKPEFSEILDKINTEQQLVAWDKGLKGTYNASLVKLLLGKHGYHEKTDGTLSGPGGKPIETVNKIERTIVDPKHTDS